MGKTAGSVAEGEVPVQKQSMEDFAKAIASSVAAAVAEATVKVQERIAPIQASKSSTVSSINPTGGERPKLSRRTFFCGAEQNVKYLTNEEIGLFNQLTRDGSYGQHGGWRVLTRKRGDKNIVFIDVPHKDINERMELPNSLVGILSMFIGYQEAAEKGIE